MLDTSPCHTVTLKIKGSLWLPSLFDSPCLYVYAYHENKACYPHRCEPQLCEAYREAETEDFLQAPEKADNRTCVHESHEYGFQKNQQVQGKESEPPHESVH